MSRAEADGRLTQGDRQEESSMMQLKKEVDEAWKMVDSARANESRLKEESEALRVTAAMRSGHF